MINKVDILGVGISSASKKTILEEVNQALKSADKKLFITTPNPEIIMYARSHLDYKDKLNSSGLALHDGVGLTIASKLMRKPLGERFSGVDFMEELVKSAEKKPVSMGFLGGRDGVAEATVDCLRKTYPWMRVGFVGEAWPQKGSSAYPKEHLDILFVAFGAPKQETWIYDHLSELPTTSAIGVGGAFDYYSGKVMRAPRLVRQLGFEWLFRLIRQPWRLKRQLVLISFLNAVIKESFS